MYVDKKDVFRFNKTCL